MIAATRQGVIEFALASASDYADPFNEVALEVHFTDPRGREYRLPAFWRGQGRWGVRYASSLPGIHRYRTVCSDRSNPDLHGREGSFEIAPCEGANPLLRHGRLRVAGDRRHLEHEDGTPFFWLGDTWWFGLTTRLAWPGDFQRLTADRVAKGFSLVQLVAGLYPDIAPFDPRGANEAGFPWSEGYRTINPAYFDMMDRRIEWLVGSGIVPCIVGAWGFFIRFAGVEVMKRHWRNLVARYAAYPVVWCVAGEATMPFYFEDWGEDYPTQARRDWTEVMRYLRELDPYRNPVTIHPPFPDSRAMVTNPSLLDVDMLQTGHGYAQAEFTLRTVREAVGVEPPLPVVNGEPMYEGIMDCCWQDMSRFCFWACMMSGAAGHTYGTNGVWQMSSRQEPFVGVTGSWGELTWEDAMHLPGSAQMGVGRRLLERYPWWRFQPWAEHQHQQVIAPLAAGIPGAVWIFYLPSESMEPHLRGMLGRQLRIEAGAAYRAHFVNPRNGAAIDIGPVRPDADGVWPLPRKPGFNDWVLVLENERELARVRDNDGRAEP